MKKGKTLSKTISRTSHAACSGVSDCSPDVGQLADNEDSSITQGAGCSDLGEYVDFDSPYAVTCAAHDHYSGKLTIQYKK